MAVVDDVLERLHAADCRPRKTGDGWSARCPAHDDKNPSLSLSEGRDGGVVLHCHAGCTPDRVCAALGLTLADLAPPRPDQNGNGHRHEVARYRYEDEAGQHLYDVIRWQPKGFSQAPADGRRGAGAMHGVRRVLYHLPSVVTAVERGGTIWITEGEKDADAIHQAAVELGGAATTNPGGAGKWRDEYSASLRGANVVIITDRDEPGRRHAAAVATALASVDVTASIVEPAQGKDASDHLAAGLTIGDFTPTQPATLEPPLRFTAPTAYEFAAVEEPGAEPLVGGEGGAVIPAGGDVMMYGDGGAGKTTLAIDGACHWAAGDTWLGMPVTRPLRVLLVENEGPRPLFRDKVRRKLAAWQGGAIRDRLRIVENPWHRASFSDTEARDALASVINQHQVEIVVMGPVTRLGMNDAGTLQEVRDFMQLVQQVRSLVDHLVVFLLIHHENKGGQVSGAWEGAGDTLLHVSGQGHGRTRLFFQKARWASEYHAKTLQLVWTDGEGFDVDDTPDVSDEDIAEQLLHAIAGSPGQGWSLIEKMTPGSSRDRRNKVRDGLFAAGRIVNVVGPKGAETVLTECAQGKRTHLYLADDPAIGALLLARGEVGEKLFSAPPVEGTLNFSAAPFSVGGGGRGEVSAPPATPLNDPEETP